MIYLVKIYYASIKKKIVVIEKTICIISIGIFILWELYQSINYIKDFKCLLNNSYEVVNINESQIKVNETTGKGQYQYIKLENGISIPLNDNQYDNIKSNAKDENRIQIYYLKYTRVILKIE